MTTTRVDDSLERFARFLDARPRHFDLAGGACRPGGAPRCPGPERWPK